MIYECIGDMYIYTYAYIRSYMCMCIYMYVYVYMYNIHILYVIIHDLYVKFSHNFAQYNPYI